MLSSIDILEAQKLSKDSIDKGPLVYDNYAAPREESKVLQAQHICYDITAAELIENVNMLLELAYEYVVKPSITLVKNEVTGVLLVPQLTPS